VIYGPIDFPLLSQWVREARVMRQNWIFTEQSESWSRAADLPELGLLFKQADELLEPGTLSDPLIPGVPVGTLQGVEIFKDMTDRQRGRFAQCMEVQKFKKFEVLVNEGDPDAGELYIILEGNVRVRKVIGGKENILATLTAGEVFCEISLFDRGKRSADIVANSSGVLLRISLEVFDRMMEKQPEVATPFLVAVARKMAARMRADNERHKKDTILMQTRG
jgi:CRP-like cAMP-binding protein